MLQGSLDDFALEEVLGLLSSTSKTGKLDVKGDRGSGSLRLDNGRLVDAGASNTANGVEPEDVLFELLRYADGNFHFTASDAEDGGHSINVAEIVASAENRLADWRTIEAIVPSLRHLVTPVAQLPEDEITLVRREWDVLIVVGSGCPVSAVCEELDLGEVEGSRRIKELTERGLLTVGPPKAASYRRPSETGTSTDSGAGLGSGSSSGAASSSTRSFGKASIGVSSLSPALPGNGSNGLGGSSSADGPKADMAGGDDVATNNAASSSLRGEPPHPALSATDGAPSALALTMTPPAPPVPGASDPEAGTAESTTTFSNPIPPSFGMDSSPTPSAAPDREPMRPDADAERSGGLLMRYLKND